ncbi:MAG: ABC transporter permease [Bacillota bacterium]|nr:ABC transporter permease [Bacillota bacterium]
MDSIKRNIIAFNARFLISMKIYFRYPINFIMTLFDPIMWLTPFYFMAKAFSSNGQLSGFSKYTGNSDYIGFLVIGYMISCYVSTIFWSMGFSLKDEMREGVLESNWSTPVSRITLMISKSSFQMTAATFEIILTGIVCHYIFGFNINNNVLTAILFLIPGLIGMLGFGLAIGAVVLLIKEANGIIDVTNSLVSGLAGGYFPVKVLPFGFLIISLILPLTYIYDSSRALLINQIPIFSLRKEFVIVLITMVAFSFLGSFIFMKVEKHCRMLGVLGTH